MLRIDDAMDPIEVPSDEEAARTVALVLALTLTVSAPIAEARDDEAVLSAVSVCALTVLAIPAVWVLVLPFTSAVTDDEALLMSACVAREPDERFAPVRVRVPLLQTSAARVPKFERLRVL